MRATEQLVTAFAGLGAVIFFATVAEVKAAPNAPEFDLPEQPTVSPDATVAPIPVSFTAAPDAVAAVSMPTAAPTHVQPTHEAAVLGGLEFAWPYDGGVDSVALGQGKQELYVELGQSPFGAELRLNTDDQRYDEVQVAFQYETSLALGFEGPHWDLLDFEHHTSDWTDLPQGPMGTYEMPELTQDQREAFPDVSSAQIHQAVRDYLSAWDEADMPPAPLCPSAHEGPCYVGVSKVTLRVRAFRKQRLVQESSVDLHLPLGC